MKLKTCGSLGIALLLTMAAFRLEAGTLCAGEPLFNDSDTCVFVDVPVPFDGKLHLLSPYYSATTLAFEQPGYGYVIAAAGSSLGDDLLKSGYVEVPFYYSPNIWTEMPLGYKLKLFEKQVNKGEALSLDSWGIVVFSEDRVVFDKSAPPSCIAMIPESREELPWWNGRHRQKLEEIKADQDFDWVFLGDSITQRWETEGSEAYAGLLSQRHILNLGYCGDRIQHVLWRLANGELKDIHPRLLVLLIGTNNLPPDRSTPSETLRGIREVVCTLRDMLPDTTILIHAVFPRGQYANDPYRRAVLETNQGLLEIVREYNLLYMDIGDIFLDPETGSVKSELMPDSLHPNADGYKMWADLLISTLAGL